MFEICSFTIPSLNLRPPPLLSLCSLRSTNQKVDPPFRKANEPLCMLLQPGAQGTEGKTDKKTNHLTAERWGRGGSVVISAGGHQRCWPTCWGELAGRTWSMQQNSRDELQLAKTVDRGAVGGGGSGGEGKGTLGRGQGVC